MLNFVNPQYIIALYSDGYAEYANNSTAGLGPFKPATKEFIESLAVSANDNPNVSGIVPPEVVGFTQLKNNYIIAFTTEPCQVDIMWNKKITKQKFPKMLWLYNSRDKNLHLYKIVKEDVYPISFSNVNSGIVCIGSSPHPTSSNFIEIINEIKSMFFDGEFTHSQKLGFVKTKLNLWKTISKFLNT